MEEQLLIFGAHQIQVLKFSLLFIISIVIHLKIIHPIFLPITTVYMLILYTTDPLFPDRCIVEISAIDKSPLNNKPNIKIYVDNTDQDDNYRYVLIGIIGRNTTVHAWANSTQMVLPYLLTRDMPILLNLAILITQLEKSVVQVKV
jgi:hypothetical protein